MGKAWGLDSGEGLLELGSLGGAGLGSLLPPVLCSVTRLFSPSPYCVKRPLTEPAAVAAPRAFRGAEAPPPRLQVGPTVRTQPPRDSFLFVKPPEAGAGRSDPAVAGGRAYGPSSCHTSLVENCAGVLEDVTEPLTRSSPGCAGAPLAGGIGIGSFLFSLVPSPLSPGYTRNCV